MGENLHYRNKKYCAYCGAKLEERELEGRVRLVCTNPDCGAVFYENPIPATALVVPHSEDKNKILLVKRAVEPAKGKYSLPGGFLEIDETPEECAIRELREETGLEGRVKRLLGVRNQPSPQYKMVLLVGYEMEVVGGELSSSDDAEDAEFFPLDNHPPIAFEAHRWFVEQYKKDIS